jgi:hypothetical protein
MMDDFWRAFGLQGFLLGSGALSALYEKGVLSREEVVDVYDQALLNLETHQALVDAAGQAPVQIAREMIAVALKTMGAAPEAPSQGR